MDKLSERMNTAIQNSKLSYRELEEKTGISKSTLQRYATGEAGKCSLPRIEKIAKATNVSPLYLMGWDEEHILNKGSKAIDRFSKRFRNLRTSHDLTQQELADKLHISKSSVNMYERGEREPGIDTLEEIADFFNVDMDYLIGKSDIDSVYKYKEIKPITTHSVPLIGSCACGKPSYADEQFECYVECGSDIHADFCVRAKGDSMINARINDGDIVFIKKQDIVNNGEIAVVIIGDEVTLKRVMYYRDRNLLILKPENPKYEDMIYQNEDLENIHILGKAIAFQGDVK